MTTREGVENHKDLEDRLVTAFEVKDKERVFRVLLELHAVLMPGDDYYNNETGAENLRTEIENFFADDQHVSLQFCLGGDSKQNVTIYFEEGNVTFDLHTEDDAIRAKWDNFRKGKPKIYAINQGFKAEN